jgi:hypothetical protein
MLMNVLRLAPKLMVNRARYGRYLDVLVAHSPPWKIHDQDDLPHQGFKSFLRLHALVSSRAICCTATSTSTAATWSRARPTSETEVINAYPYKIIELDTKQWR